MQVDFTGLATIRPHRSLLPRQGTEVNPKGQWSTDQSRSGVGPEHPCSCDERRVGLGLAGHGCLAPRSVLEHVMRAGGRWGALADLRSERQLESEISLTKAAIAIPLAISPKSKMLDSGSIATPVA